MIALPAIGRTCFSGNTSSSFGVLRTTYALRRARTRSTFRICRRHSPGHLVAVLGNPVELEGRQSPVVVRSGLAIYPTTGSHANVLVQNAESALRTARARGQRHQHYSVEQHTAVMPRLALEHKLRSVLERNQFELHSGSVEVNLRSIRPGTMYTSRNNAFPRVSP